MSRVVLPDFRHPNISTWYQQRLTKLVEYMIDINEMPAEDLMGFSLTKNSPLVYSNALIDESDAVSNASFCNVSSSNLGPFVPKKEWKLETNSTYTIDDMDGKCSWNISGTIVDIPDCSMKYLDPASRYNSSDVIGTKGTMCPLARHISNGNATTIRHISSHNVYALQHVKETRSSVNAIKQLENTFILSEHSSSSFGGHGAILGSRFESSWQGIKVSS